MNPYPIIVAPPRACPACRAADELRSPELAMVVGIAWGIWISGGYPAHVAAIRTRELLCPAHADMVMSTARLMREQSD
jgi:hypothetical protein